MAVMVHHYFRICTSLGIFQVTNGTFRLHSSFFVTSNQLLTHFFRGFPSLNSKESPTCWSDGSQDLGSFSSPEPLALICNRPRDQETTGSGDENELNIQVAHIPLSYYV